MSEPNRSRPDKGDRAVATCEQMYRFFLRAYPREFRDEYGDEMALCFRDLCRDEPRQGNRASMARLWVRTLMELAPAALMEWRPRLGRIAYRAAIGLACATALFLVWVNLAVGMIGSEDDRSNLMYFGVLAIGIFGAAIARFRSHGMARALFATALAQTVVAVIALLLGLGAPWSEPIEIVILNGMFVALYVGSALLFLYAGQTRTPAGASSDN